MPYPRAVRDDHRELCEQVYELRELGLGCVRISRKVEGISLATISRWLGYPERFFPWIDEICIERALEGDRGAFDALTIWERDLFWDRLQAKRMSMKARAWEEWVHIYAGRLGMKGGDIGDRLHKRYGAGFKYRPPELRLVPPQRGKVLIRRKDRFGRRRFI